MRLIKRSSVAALGVACALFPSLSALAQDVLMARGNAMVTAAISPINFYGNAVRNGMSDIRFDVQSDLKRFEYTADFSKPLSLTAEYALSSYTTVGININRFSYSLSETREDDFGTVSTTTKGSHLDLHLRAVRYFYATPRSAMYLLGEIGAQTRSISYGNDAGTDLAYINTFPETRPGDYKTLSYDYGLGLKVRLFAGVGLSAELTMLNLAGRYGLFYQIQPAGRRSKDNIGW